MYEKFIISFIYKLGHIVHMGVSEDSESCTIRFTDESEQVKAFNHLIHSKASFSGIEKNTITIRKSDCVELKSKDIHYEEIS